MLIYTYMYIYIYIYIYTCIYRGDRERKKEEQEVRDRERGRERKKEGEGSTRAQCVSEFGEHKAQGVGKNSRQYYTGIVIEGMKEVGGRKKGHQ